jgi:hypothetical protein
VDRSLGCPVQFRADASQFAGALGNPEFAFHFHPICFVPSTLLGLLPKLLTIGIRLLFGTPQWFAGNTNAMGKAVTPIGLGAVNLVDMHRFWIETQKASVQFNLVLQTATFVVGIPRQIAR